MVLTVNSIIMRARDDTRNNYGVIMPFRVRTIRTKIMALLVVPLVSLVGLWGFGAFITAESALDVRKMGSNYQVFGHPAEELLIAIQEERRASVGYLATSDSAISGLRDAQIATSRALSILREAAAGDREDMLDPSQRDSLSRVLKNAEEIYVLRKAIATGHVSWTTELAWYSNLTDPFFVFLRSFSDGEEYKVYIDFLRAREQYAQADSILFGMRTARDVTNEQATLLNTALNAHSSIFSTYLPDLDAENHVTYNKIMGGSSWKVVRNHEEAFRGRGYNQKGLASMDIDSWSDSIATTLNQLREADGQLAEKAARKRAAFAQQAIIRACVVSGASFLAIIVSALISIRIGRSLAQELLGLRNAARDLTEVRLPQVMRMLRHGERVDLSKVSTPLDSGLKEIKQVGRAFNAVQRSAISAAAEQAELRQAVFAVFANLARRSQVLLHRQLTLLDAMERNTEDPTRLDELFRLDHLTTRMRRHAEGLLILSGATHVRAWRRPVPMVDVVRAAVSEVEEYQRVSVQFFQSQRVLELVGPVVGDLVHLLAELVENATLYSPPFTQVTVRGEDAAAGFVVQIDDRGVGMQPDLLAGLNQQLLQEQEFDLRRSDRLGLFVVSRLANRHGLRVTLSASPYGGISAVVLVPLKLFAQRDTRQRETGDDEEPTHSSTTTGHRPLSPASTDAPAPDLRENPSSGQSSGPPPLSTRTQIKSKGRTYTPPPTHVPRPSQEHEREEDLVGEVARPAPALPRRVRQANLAPQLRVASASASSTSGLEPDRSPERARYVFAAFHRVSVHNRADNLNWPSEIPPESALPSGDPKSASWSPGATVECNKNLTPPAEQ